MGKKRNASLFHFENPIIFQTHVAGFKCKIWTLPNMTIFEMHETMASQQHVFLRDLIQTIWEQT